jgi:NADH-quinone oxidoreductase subunit N
MIGIPPLAGFFTKLFILSSILNQSFYWIILIVLIFSTLSGYYYLNFIKYILFENKKLINLFLLDINCYDLLFFMVIFLFSILLFFIFLFPIMNTIIMKVSFSCLFKFSSLII